jgi:hypothetical protein
LHKKKKRDIYVSVIFTVTVRLWHSRLYFNSCFDSPLSFEYWHLSWLWRMENILCSKTYLESRRQMKFKPTIPTKYNCHSH